MLFIKSKIQFSESKSQLGLLSGSTGLGCLSSQRYNFLKANHNLRTWPDGFNELFIKSKIQFSESKSQPKANCLELRCSCLSSQRYNFLKANHNLSFMCSFYSVVVYQVKDTIFWKQITTGTSDEVNVESLFIKSKIQFSESKSQQKHPLQHCQAVVYQVKDTIFWKQITTIYCWHIF